MPVNLREDTDLGPGIRPLSTDRSEFQPIPLELRLVISCSWIASPQYESAQRDSIQSLCEECVDWGAFLALAHRHQVVSVAADRLLKFAPESLPSEIKAELKEGAGKSWRHSVAMAKELLAVVQVLQESGIESIPLKGPVLASRLFGDPGLRDVLDLDLLVRFEDLSSADAVLKSRGYTRLVPAAEVTPKQLRVLFDQCHHWVYLNPALRIPLELHWRIFRWSNAETEALWNRSLAQPWIGTNLRQMDDAMLLLSLCDHGSQHRYNRLKWLSDIVMLLSKFGDEECRETLELACAMNLELPLAQATNLIHWLYGVPPPSQLLAFAKSDATAQRLGQEALQCILDDDVTPYSPKQERAGLRHLWFWAQRSRRLAWYSTHLRKNTPWASRVKPLLIGVTDFEAFPLPDRWFWLYYPLRPVFWFVRCLRGR